MPAIADIKFDTCREAVENQASLSACRLPLQRSNKEMKDQKK